MNLVQEQMVKNRIDSDNDYAYSLLYYLIVERAMLKNEPIRGLRSFTYHQNGALNDVECVLECVLQFSVRSGKVAK